MTDLSTAEQQRTIDTARQVADFAYKQGVGESVAVDHLIRDYERVREERDLLAAYLRWRRDPQQGPPPLTLDALNALIDGGQS